MNDNMKIIYVFPVARFFVHKVKTVKQLCKNVNMYHIHPCTLESIYFAQTRFFYSECNKLCDMKDSITTAPVDSKDESFDINIITNGDPIMEKKLKILFLEVEILRQEGNRVPSNVKLSQWQELIKMNTRSMRRKYFTFLWKNEIKRINETKKKEERRLKKEEELNTCKSKVKMPHLDYALHKNTIFLRVYDSTITHFNNCKLMEAMLFNQKLVVDCGYDFNMTSRETVNCAKQLMLLFSENRIHPEPFNLYLCNANKQGHTLKELQKFIPTLYDDNFPLNITEKSYLDLFPKKDIVYLTPHCREEMVTFDHDTIYIVGAIVDKINKEPLSLAKAKQEGLRMAKLPLDRYLKWGSGSGKSLTLNQMIQILLELHSNGDWRRALKHVPRRKIGQNYNCREGYHKNLRGEISNRQRTCANNHDKYIMSKYPIIN